MAQSNIFIVDDNEIFIEGLKFFIEKFLHHKVIGQAGDGVDFLDKENTWDADIILMDIEMPVMNGFEAAKKYGWKIREPKFIAITSYQDKAYLQQLIASGFKGCVYKQKIHEDLNNAINQVLEGKIYFPQDIKM